MFVVKVSVYLPRPFFMANSYFRFKQFKVDQSDTAMKVCTEACVLGAVAEAPSPHRILDIGAGTGLLSLMLAQKYSCPVDAVEIEEHAYRQATSNFGNSPWKERLTLFHSSIQEYMTTTSFLYDLIVCNPPFFTSHLTSENSAKNLALHNAALSQEALSQSIGGLLSQRGVCYLLLPPSESDNFDKVIVGKGLFLQGRTILYDRPGSICFPVHFPIWF